MSAFAKPSRMVLIWCVTLVLGCGGKAQTPAQKRSSGGQGGGSQGGQGGEAESGGQAPGPGAHVSECEELCARTEEAGCSAGAEECVIACATVTGFAGCQPQIDAWISCAQIAEVICDESGAPTFTSCEEQLTAAAVCAATTVPTPVVQETCSSYCDELEATGCDTTNPLGDCRQACGLAGMVVVDCQSKFIQFIDCAVASGESCDASGVPNTSVCLSKQLAYSGCMLSAVGESTQLDAAGGSGAK